MLGSALNTNVHFIVESFSSVSLQPLPPQGSTYQTSVAMAKSLSLAFFLFYLNWNLDLEA